MHLVQDLNLGAARAAARVDKVHGQVFLDAVLRGDIHARLHDSAARETGDPEAARNASAEAGLLQGGAPDARGTDVELAAAAAAAVLDRAAAADIRRPLVCCRHAMVTVLCENREG